MKRNTLTIVVGALLILIFVLLLFTFQVRQTEVAVVTTFGNPSRFIEKPGFQWKWPVPIQKVYKFDKRIQNFEGRFEQTLTQDGYSLLAQVFMGWTIHDPKRFFDSFPGGTAEEATPKLEGLVHSAKLAVIGRHPFAHFVSVDEQELQLTEIEKEIHSTIEPIARANYGISVQFVGFKRLGFPESITERVFERMRAERQRQVARLRAQGEAEAMNVRSGADLQRSKILAEARAKATVIRGEAEREASKSLAVFQESPQLAITLLKLRALQEALKEKSTLILDERTAPFDLLVTQPQAMQQAPEAVPSPGAPAVSGSGSGSGAAGGGASVEERASGTTAGPAAGANRVD